jgi:hypothetical protein
VPRSGTKLVTQLLPGAHAKRAAGGGRARSSQHRRRLSQAGGQAIIVSVKVLGGWPRCLLLPCRAWMIEPH